MRFFHLSDLHIGKHLHHYNLKEDQKHILGEIVSYAKELHPDAIVIAGDVYDKNIPSLEAVNLFSDFLSRIYKLGKKSGSTDVSSHRIFYPLTAQSGNNTETLTSVKHAKSIGLTNLNDTTDSNDKPGGQLYTWRNDSKDGEQGTGKRNVGTFVMGANKSKITKRLKKSLT